MNNESRYQGGEAPQESRDPQTYSVPIRLGDATVGWTTQELASRLSQAPTPHLLLVPMPLPEVLGLRSGRRFILVPQSAITYVSSRGGLVTAYTDQGRFWSDLTLKRVERRLTPRLFYRLDVSHLVNVTRLAELLPHTHQRYVLRFADAARTELIVSRDVGRRLRAALGW